ncbi:MAG: hypothetical protein RBR08_08835 [Desulforegulaceae bacterium]|nr:hypothetical protein [Desulforegulaceae bacterium]
MEQSKTIMEFKNCNILDQNISLPEFSFLIEENDVVEIESLDDEKSSLFIRGLATLAPLRGEIMFKGSLYDPLDYENLLKLKRQIGYLGPLCSLLSNRSILENIFLFKMWEENLKKIKLDESFMNEFKQAGILEYIYKRPEKTTEEIKCGTYLVREFLKKPGIVFLERPYLFTRGKLSRFLCNNLKDSSQKKVPIVFFSNTGFVPATEVTHKIIVENDKIEKIKVE